MGLYGAIPRRGRRVSRVGNGGRRAQRAFARSPTPTRSASPTSRPIAQGRPASPALDRLQSVLPLFASRSAERRRGAQETTITERLVAAPRHSRRPAPAGQALSGGNQQKVALAEMAAARAVGVASERSDARRRRRDQARDLPRAPRDGRRGQGRRPAQLRHARTGPSLRSGHGVQRGPGGRRLCRTPRRREEAIVAAAMGVRKAPTLEGEAV